MKKEEKKEAQEEAEELVTDIEQVKNAIQVCLDFGKERGMHLINPRGRKEFSELYRREEPRRRIEQIIDVKINERLDEKIDPLNSKIDIMLELMKEKLEIDEVDKLPPAKPDKKS